MVEAEQPILLIIDDNRVSVTLLTRLLAEENYRIESCRDGETGLARAHELQPDLILLDVVMPGIDGFEVCRRIRSAPSLTDIPILMLTSLEDDESRLAGIEAGADDFITKPYRVTELRARVRTVVRLNRYRRLRNERARFGWVVEKAEEGYLLVDEAGNLLFANAKARTLFGLTGNSAQGQAALSLIQAHFNLHPAEDWANWPDLPERTLQLVRPESSRARAVWLEVRALTNWLGSAREILLQLRDVTTEMASQRSVWSFEALISHKLRTPLTKISLGLNFIAKKADKLSVEKIKEFAEMSSGGVVDLKRELEEVLSYLNTPTAAPTDGGFELKDLPRVLSEIGSQLEVSPVLSCPISGTLFLSRRGLEIILWELLRNSKKFHPDGKPAIELRVSQEIKFVLVEIQDDGMSLSPEQLKKACLPYFQGESVFTGQVPGMGLGLSMISSMLREVGGSCSLRNRFDGGTGIAVELHIPLAESAPSED